VSPPLAVPHKAYTDAAISRRLEALSEDIKRLAAKFSYAYAPSFVELSKIMALPAGQRPIKTISNRRAPAKGKTKEVLCPEFEKEKLWLRKKLRTFHPLIPVRSVLIQCTYSERGSREEASGCRE
jgi:hypothetical protein